MLRDVSEPQKTLALSDRAENLEGIESRMKADILAEGLRFGGLVLTHNEVGKLALPVFPIADLISDVN